MPIWLNIDLPVKFCRLHEENCRHVQTKTETPYKKIGRLGRDGGWLEFDSASAASQYFREEVEPRGIPEIEECQDCH